MNLTYADFLLTKSVQPHSLRNLHSVDGAQCKKNLPLYLNKQEAAKTRSERKRSLPVRALLGRERPDLNVRRIDQNNEVKSDRQPQNQVVILEDEHDSSEDESPQRLKPKSQSRPQPIIIEDVIRSRLKESLSIDLVQNLKFEFDLQRIRDRINGQYNKNQLGVDDPNFRTKQFRNPDLLARMNEAQNQDDEVKNLCTLQRKHNLNILQAFGLENELNIKLQAVKEEQLKVAIQPQNQSNENDQNTNLQLDSKHRYQDKDRQMLAQLELLGSATEILHKARSEQMQRVKSEQFLTSPKSVTRTTPRRQHLIRNKLSVPNSPGRSQLLSDQSGHQEVTQQLMQKYILQQSRRNSLQSQGLPSPGTLLVTSFISKSPDLINARNLVQSRKSSTDCLEIQRKKRENLQEVNGIKEVFYQFQEECGIQRQQIITQKPNLRQRIREISVKKDTAFKDLKFKEVPSQFRLNKEFKNLVDLKHFRNRLVTLLMEQLAEKDKHVLAVSVRLRDR